MQINLNTDSPRTDFVLQNETTEVFIAATTGLKVRKSKASWTKAAKAGEIIRLAFPEESEVVGRVVLGELAEDEEAQWIAEAGSPIDLPDGEFVIDTSPFLSSREYRDWQVHEGYQLFAVPPGRYRLRVLTYLNSVSGDDLLRLSSKAGYWNYFANSHDNRDVPEWVATLAEDNDEDIPANVSRVHTPDYSLVDFLFQLIPTTSDEPATTLRSDGTLKQEIRQPSIFPLGIPTQEMDSYLLQKKAKLEPLMRGVAERIEAEHAAAQVAKTSKKADEQSVAALFDNEAEWFREKQFDKLLRAVSANIADSFVDYCEEQLSAYRQHGFEVDPINPLTEHGAKAMSADVELWATEYEGCPRKLVDQGVLDPTANLLELIWNYRDQSVTDIFNRKHMVSVRLLLSETQVGWKIAGIEWAPMV